MPVVQRALRLLEALEESSGAASSLVLSDSEEDKAEGKEEAGEAEEENKRPSTRKEPSAKQRRLTLINDAIARLGGRPTHVFVARKNPASLLWQPGEKRGATMSWRQSAPGARGMARSIEGLIRAALQELGDLEARLGREPSLDLEEAGGGDDEGDDDEEEFASDSEQEYDEATKEGRRLARARRRTAVLQKAKTQAAALKAQAIDAANFIENARAEVRQLTREHDALRAEIEAATADRDRLLLERRECDRKFLELKAKAKRPPPPRL